MVLRLGMLEALTRTLHRKIVTAVADLRYGGRFLTGKIESRKAHLGGYDIESTGYDLLPAMFDGRVRSDDVLVDVGRGKGRVLNWWLAHYPSHRIYGLELDQEIGELTRKRLRKYSNVQILIGDACSLMPPDGTLFYLYNPFDADVMRRFISRLISSPRGTNGLTRRVLYYNSTYVDRFRSHPSFVVQTVELPRPMRCVFIELVPVEQSLLPLQS